jgi:hypothetical protein
MHIELMSQCMRIALATNRVSVTSFGRWQYSQHCEEPDRGDLSCYFQDDLSADCQLEFERAVLESFPVKNITTKQAFRLANDAYIRGRSRTRGSQPTPEEAFIHDVNEQGHQDDKLLTMSNLEQRTGGAVRPGESPGAAVPSPTTWGEPWLQARPFVDVVAPDMSVYPGYGFCGRSWWETQITR